MMLRRSLLILVLAGVAAVAVPGGAALGQTFTGTGAITDTSLWTGGTLPNFGGTSGRMNINGITTYTAAQGTTSFGGDRGVVIGSTTNATSKLTVTGGTISLTASGVGLVGAPGNSLHNDSELHLNGGNLTTVANFGIAGNSALNAGSNARIVVSAGSTLTAPGIDFGSLSANTSRIGSLIVETGGLVVTGSILERYNVDSRVNLNGGTIQASGANNKIWISSQTTLTDTGATAAANTNGTRIIVGSLGGTLNSGGLNGQRVTSNISGTGAMTVTGGGSIAFEGANTYAGGTTVASGTRLNLGNAGAIGTGSLNLLGTLQTAAAGVNIGDGTGPLETLTLTGNIVGSASLNGVELSGFGVGPEADVSGNLSLAGLSRIKWDFNSATEQFNLLSIGGDVTFGTGTIFDLGNVSLANGFYALGSFAGTMNDFSNVSLANDNGGQYSLTLLDNQFGVTAVPEPSSMALLGLVGAAVAVRRRMKKAKA